MPVSISLEAIFATSRDEGRMIPEEMRQLLARIAEEPDDRTAWIAAADWCNEQGEPRLKRAFEWIGDRPGVEVFKSGGEWFIGVANDSEALDTRAVTLLSAVSGAGNGNNSCKIYTTSPHDREGRSGKGGSRMQVAFSGIGGIGAMMERLSLVLVNIDEIVNRPEHVTAPARAPQKSDDLNMGDLARAMAKGPIVG